MRVIGGKYRSRKLDAFAGESVRPTADRTRESLFNILQGKIVGARFLDAFSGTGAGRRNAFFWIRIRRARLSPKGISKDSA